MAQIGYITLILALCSALYVIIAVLSGLKNTQRITNAAKYLHVVTGLLTAAVLYLLVLLLQRNFQIKYVASYTDLTLPPVYVLSALWAGQEGSLLFWGWLLSLCSSLFLWKNPLKLSEARQIQQAKGQKNSSQSHPATIEYAYMMISIAVVLGFFLILLLIMANPFERLDFRPPDGKGMNPLLQNLYMAIHPPVLFIGYAGFIVPFALAFGMLGSGVIAPERLKTLRRWLLFAWYFLGIGIILGAHWAYLELGWGGYWAWDPVENASLIPWLTGTALIHTLALQRRKGLLQLWNIFLCILTFSLCIFATFVTRSGMIESVHAFGQSTIGYYFLGFLLLVFLVMIGLLVKRWQDFRTHSTEASLLSKEGSFFLTNQLFIGLGAAVVYGTMYPFFMELFTGRKVTVSTAFFNRISIPVGLIILGVIGLCQIIPWKTASLNALVKRLLLPFGGAVTVMLVLFLIGVRHGLTVLTCGLGVFVFFTMLVDVSETLEQRLRRKTPEEFVGSVVFRTFATQKRLYAAYIFHLGVVLMYLGIAVSSTYRLEKEVTLSPGSSATLGNIRFQYGQLSMSEDPQKVSIAADVTVYRNEHQIAALTPQKRFYGKEEDSQMTTEIGLRSSLTNDIYVILAGWQEDQTATFTFIIHPMIIWIWVGGFFVFTIGMVVLLLPNPKASQHNKTEIEH